MEGLFRKPSSSNPTGVNNSETLANVPHIRGGIPLHPDPGGTCFSARVERTANLAMGST